MFSYRRPANSIELQVFSLKLAACETEGIQTFCRCPRNLKHFSDRHLIVQEDGQTIAVGNNEKRGTWLVATSNLNENYHDIIVCLHAFMPGLAGSFAWQA